jgi:hypothetical protein
MDRAQGACRRPVRDRPELARPPRLQTRLTNASDYNVTFSPTQWTGLRQIFRDGVCDYSVQGEGQKETARAWTSWGPARKDQGTADSSRRRDRRLARS